jgi:hypothetical protein
LIALFSALMVPVICVMPALRAQSASALSSAAPSPIRCQRSPTPIANSADSGCSRSRM